MQDAHIYEEMGQTTTAQITYTCAYGGKLYLSTHLDLVGRGITQASKGENNAKGKKSYYATEKALDVLKAKYTVCYLASL